MIKQSATRYLVVGQGLAGSFLAHYLLEKGQDVLVVDGADAGSSSSVAGGVINPVTGKFIVKSWKADELVPFAASAYRAMEEVLGTALYHPVEIVRLFRSDDQREKWYQKVKGGVFDPFAGDFVPPGSIPGINDYAGGFVIKGGSRVDTESFIIAYRERLKKEGRLIHGLVSYSDLHIFDGYAEWQGEKFGRVIFCEGYRAKENPWFGRLPFLPAKGEILDIRCPGLQLGYIINKGIFILPLGDGLFRVGSTFEKTYANTSPSREGRAELELSFRELVSLPYEVTGHRAGVRPAMADYRPVLGVHPGFPVLGILNGLGTKGVYLAPYFAYQLAGFLVDGSEIDPAVAIGNSPARQL